MAGLMPTPTFIFNHLLKLGGFFAAFLLKYPPDSAQDPQSGYGHVWPAREMETSYPEIGSTSMTLSLGFPVAEPGFFHPS